ncbi:MAG TPA: hypothetical protein VFR11_04985 [Micromonosporaceae bacterium]|jgi:hypothetical protein|nr:hypothetical protein [Micromonosporaceae bacterium]
MDSAGRRGEAEREEAAAWRPLDEVTAARDDGGRWTDTLTQIGRDWHRYLDVHGQRSAAAGLLAAFVLLVVSQSAPWASVGAANVDHSQDVPIGVDGGSTVLVLTYYVMWTIVLSLAGATVFAPPRVRQPLFGATIGALVVQFVAILPLVRHPKMLVSAEVAASAQFRDATELLVTRQPGMFCAVTALVVLAAAMVCAVGGNVMPAAPVPASPDAEIVDAATTDGSLGDASSTEAAETVGRHSANAAPPTSPAPVGTLSVDALHVEAVEALPEAPLDPPAGPLEADHSAYVRPLGNEQYRR